MVPTCRVLHNPSKCASKPGVSKQQLYHAIITLFQYMKRTDLGSPCQTPIPYTLPSNKVPTRIQTYQWNIFIPTKTMICWGEYFMWYSVWYKCLHRILWYSVWYKCLHRIFTLFPDDWWLGINSPIKEKIFCHVHTRHEIFRYRLLIVAVRHRLRTWIAGMGHVFWVHGMKWPTDIECL